MEKVFVNLFMEATDPVAKPVETTAPAEVPPPEPEPVAPISTMMKKVNLINNLAKLKEASLKTKEIIIKNPDTKNINTAVGIAKLNEIYTNANLYLKIISDTNFDEITKFVNESIAFINTQLELFKIK